ncbi:MAG: hypothetical protein JWP13_169 [Candidatus Saccharibacteria bacterium]|nr:hypothetical protein [Candidatus Saccharibacteria bacterium]
MLRMANAAGLAQNTLCDEFSPSTVALPFWYGHVSWASLIWRIPSASASKTAVACTMSSEKSITSAGSVAGGLLAIWASTKFSKCKSVITIRVWHVRSAPQLLPQSWFINVL